MPARIFISYAKEDIQAATNVRDELLHAGHRPWLDSHELVGGQQWDVAIRKALRDADLIVLLLSRCSVSKRGYVQREMKIALDLWEEKLDSDIFIIPIRLDDCEVPERLRRFQWIDLLAVDGLHRLRKAVASAILETDSPTNRDPLPYRLESTSLVEESTEPRLSASVAYPIVVSDSNAFIETCNRLVAASAEREFRTFIGEEKMRDVQEPTSDFERLPRVLETYWTATIHRADLLGIVLHTYRYSGGVHGGNFTEHFMFDLTAQRRLALADLFAKPANGLVFLREWCRCELRKQALGDAGEYDWTWIDSGTEDMEAPGFSLTDDALVLHFGEYLVGPYSWGPRQVEVPYPALSHNCADSGSFSELVKQATSRLTQQ